MPSFVKTEKDEELWNKAKEIVQKEYNKSESDGDDYWRLVTGIYKRMVGGHAEKSIYSLSELTLLNGYSLQKSKNKSSDTPEGVHKDLPPGGVWRTIRGHHVYIVNGKIVAGSVPHVWKTGQYVAMDKETMAKHQAKLDEKAEKETAKAKTTKKTAKKASEEPKEEPKKTTKRQPMAKLGGAGRVLASERIAQLKEAAKKHKNGHVVENWTDKQWSDFFYEHRKAPVTSLRKFLSEQGESKKGAGKDAEKASTKAGTNRKSAGKPSAKSSGAKSGSKKASEAKTTTTKNTKKPKSATGNAKEQMAKNRKDIDAIVNSSNNHKANKKARETTKEDIESFGSNPKVKQGKGATKADLDAMLASNPPKKKAKETTRADLDAMLGEMPKKAAEPKTTKTAKKAKAEVKDIRTEAQKNRELAYDVGDKIGGARKDTYQRNFYLNPTPQALQELEQWAPELAQVACRKENILKKVDFEAEYKRGTDVNVAFLKQLIYDRISPRPSEDTPEARMKYLSGIRELHRVLTPIKTWDDMQKAIRDLSDLARAGAGLAEAKHRLANAGQYFYLNTEYYQEKVRKGEEAKAKLDFEALGDKLNNFFTDYKARERTYKTLLSKKLSWDKYFNPNASAEPEKRKVERGAQKKRWERRAVDEHQRTGGRETPVKKPEDMVKVFGMRGVEFGHWVDDAAGLYHLKRSAEAFHDLADILGMDDKDVSLNGRLAIAFGARGKGRALAHYEPGRKVINMTKYGGAGSLAHEWGHALDNILYQYSHGGKGSISMASEGDMGDHDQKLKELYNNLMEAIMKPAPGDKGGTKKIKLDSSKKLYTTYYPEMRRDVESGMSPQDVYTKWAGKINNDIDRQIRAVKNNPFRTPADIEKRVKALERQRTREMNDLAGRIAQEFRYKMGGHKTGEHFQAEIEVPTGHSEYYTRMQELDGNGKSYYAQPDEMFARVFESYIEDKLNAAKRKNNYLVWDTKTTRGSDAPFPVDKERKHMHSAMEALLKYVVKGGALKKALEMELRKGYLTFNHPALSGETKRYAYPVDWTRGTYTVEDVFYIPVNRLNMVYQTEAATDWDKVKENMDRMRAGEALEPVVIGYDYDIHDGHHRWLAAKALDHTHVPCVVGGTNELDVQRAKEKYAELWKSIIPDPTGTSPFPEDGTIMFRGIGQRELDFIRKHGYIQSKGKGNDDDKEDRETCFSTTFRQAEGYARSNYDLYGETAAYVIVVPRPPWVEEDEHGELIARRPVPVHNVTALFPIPKDERV